MVQVARKQFIAQLTKNILFLTLQNKTTNIINMCIYKNFTYGIRLILLSIN